MSNQAITDGVNVGQLPTGDFTDSDVVRIEFGQQAASLASKMHSIAVMLCEDQAVAGDYLAAALQAQHSLEFNLIRSAVVAERVRGTSWKEIGRQLLLTAAEAKQQWDRHVTDWQRTSPAHSCYRKNPGGGTPNP
ncbi:hypothetical protein AB0O20_35935 [Streptomyces kronopolitis]|uniref:hypothetical protein n=1 Tax=Streptomyces kronopolitis TaxID=1612435 RepID=UPI0034262309